MLGVASSLILYVKGEVQRPAHELGVCANLPGILFSRFSRPQLSPLSTP